MKKINMALLALSLSAAPAIPLSAQPSEGPPAEGRKLVLHPRSPLFMALDLDGDGVISTEEIAHAPESLAALDRNHDGRITPDEIRPRLLRRQAGDEGEAGPRQYLRRADEEGPGPRKLFRETDEEGSEPRIVFRETAADGSGPRLRLRGADEERPIGAVVKIVSPLFKALDLDGDGILSSEEIANSWLSLLELDLDGDGALTLDEVRPARGE
jgi:Ca2+-binding EF-hand superfamily protein